MTPDASSSSGSERVCCFADILLGVGCGQLCADARLAHRYDGVGEGNGVNAVGEQTLSEIGGTNRVAEHDWHDRRLPREHLEPRVGQQLPEELRVGSQVGT